jgi:putative DNA primase/helicase
VKLNEARVKALTGCDSITARHLYSQLFTFIPVAKFWLAVNHRPEIRDDSHGFWRRIHLIPFMRTFPLSRTLADELRAEACGILAWAIRGCSDWQRHGLAPPAAVVDATRKYKTDSDHLNGFFEQACRLETTATVGAAELFERYKRWFSEQGLEAGGRLSGTMFGLKVKQRFEREHTVRGAVYRGLALAAPPE